MRFSINIPNLGDLVDPRTVATVAAAAEHLLPSVVFVHELKVAAGSTIGNTACAHHEVRLAVRSGPGFVPGPLHTALCAR